MPQARQRRGHGQAGGQGPSIGHGAARHFLPIDIDHACAAIPARRQVGKPPRSQRARRHQGRPANAQRRLAIDKQQGTRNAASRIANREQNHAARLHRLWPNPSGKAGGGTGCQNRRIGGHVARDPDSALQ